MQVSLAQPRWTPPFGGLGFRGGFFSGAATAVGRQPMAKTKPSVLAERAERESQAPKRRTAKAKAKSKAKALATPKAKSRRTRSKDSVDFRLDFSFLGFYKCNCSAHCHFSLHGIPLQFSSGHTFDPGLGFIFGSRSEIKKTGNPYSQYPEHKQLLPWTVAYLGRGGKQWQ